MTSPAQPHPSARALRVMAIVRWALLAAVTLAAALAIHATWGDDSSTHTAAAARYVCPIHPEVRSAVPGTCPICHMDLVPIAEGRAPAHDHAAQDAPPGTTTVELAAAQQRLIGLATSAVQRASLGERVRVPAVVAAPDTGLSQVRVRVPGFIEAVAVRQTGVRVARGQVLAHVFSPELYRAQQELLAAARWGGDGKAAGGAELVEAARQALELMGLAPADLDEIVRAGRPLRAVPVRANASGYVTKLGAILGARAEPEMVLYEIADLSTVWAIASVLPADVAALPQGSEARFWPHAATAPLLGKVVVVEPFADEVTRTVRVRIALANRGGALRPGQLGEVELERPTADGLFVPRDAIIHTGERSYVYVATGPDRFSPRLVTPGTSRGELAEVKSGLAEGERVVTRGNFALDSESRLQASLAERSAAPSAPVDPAAPPSHATEHAK